MNKASIDKIIELVQGVKFQTTVGKIAFPSGDEILLFEEIADGKYDNGGYPYQVIRAYISEGLEEMTEITDSVNLLVEYIESHFSAEQIEKIEYSLVDY